MTKGLKRLRNKHVREELNRECGHRDIAEDIKGVDGHTCLTCRHLLHVQADAGKDPYVKEGRVCEKLSVPTGYGFEAGASSEFDGEGIFVVVEPP